jgi:putative ABC transport system substrate-binding protein
MKRRDLILAAGVLALAPRVHAQSQRVRRVGILLPSKANEGLLAPYSKRLGELGWVEGRNLAIEARNADNRYERFASLAAELVRLNVEVIVTASTPVTRAAKEATATIPVVFAWVADPVESGLVASLGRPGGNLTGLSNVVFDIASKQFELLKALIPRVEHVAELRDPKWQIGEALSARLKDAASRTGVILIQVDASSADELNKAFAAAARGRATAMVVPPLPLYGAHAKRIAQLSKHYRIPTVSQARHYVAAGGLASYGSNLVDGFLRTATYVDKILRGAKPADLPVEQSDRFELVVNRKTAAELGITIPQSVLLQATEVIE